VSKGPQLPGTVTGVKYAGNVEHWSFYEGLYTGMSQEGLCGRSTRNQETKEQHHEGAGVITDPPSPQVKLGMRTKSDNSLNAEGWIADKLCLMTTDTKASVMNTGPNIAAGLLKTASYKWHQDRSFPS
jgi:hypothetical protein